MITLINATNRPENLTGKVVELYSHLLSESGQANQIFELAELQNDFIFNASFGKASAHMDKIVNEKIIPAQKFVFIAPEYHGSYPGVLKAFLDAVETKHFRGKRAALVGVASGRAGNLRGMDHLTDVLHHMGVEVLSYKVPISKLNSLFNEHGALVEAETTIVLKKQIELFSKF